MEVRLEEAAAEDGHRIAQVADCMPRDGLSL